MSLLPLNPPETSFDDINAALASAGDDFDSVVEELSNSEPATLPDHYWTGRLLSAGFSIDDCLAIRSLDRITLLQHALAFVRGGGVVDLAKLIAPATLAMLAVKSSKGSGTLDEFRRMVGAGVSAEDIELFWLARNRG